MGRNSEWRLWTALGLCFSDICSRLESRKHDVPLKSSGCNTEIWAWNRLNLSSCRIEERPWCSTTSRSQTSECRKAENAPSAYILQTLLMYPCDLLPILILQIQTPHVFKFVPKEMGVISSSMCGICGILTWKYFLGAVKYHVPYKPYSKEDSCPPKIWPQCI